LKRLSRNSSSHFGVNSLALSAINRGFAQAEFHDSRLGPESVRTCLSGDKRAMASVPRRDQGDIRIQLNRGILEWPKWHERIILSGQY
jgi:hypothetical protein